MGLGGGTLFSICIMYGVHSYMYTHFDFSFLFFVSFLGEGGIVVGKDRQEWNGMTAIDRLKEKRKRGRGRGRERKRERKCPEFG